ncbi:Ank3 [Symbiodinium necroappetens]|uniref:Ank3 protein n=1 Tax=Symbiodinium necroappetens TaxID=1628268 RepID=A0A812WEX5_9DINO|nr:Ank3 [Symbiodinium necroappetens]
MGLTGASPSGGFGGPVDQDLERGEDGRSKCAARGSARHSVRSICSRDSEASFCTDKGASRKSDKPNQLVVKKMDIDPSSRSMFTAPPVVVQLRVLEGMSAADACHLELLKSLAEAPNKAVFQTDAVEAVVSAAWQQYRLQTVLEATFSILTVILLCVASYTSKIGQSASAGALWGIFALHIKRTVEEVWQYVHCTTCGKVHRARCLDFDNIADLVYCSSDGSQVCGKCCRMSWKSHSCPASVHWHGLEPCTPCVVSRGLVRDSFPYCLQYRTLKR